MLRCRTNCCGGCCSCTIFWAQISPRSTALDVPFQLVLLWQSVCQSDELSNIKMLLVYPPLTAVTTFILQFSLHTTINHNTCLLEKTVFFLLFLQYLLTKCCFSHLSWCPFGMKSCRIPLWTYHHCIYKSTDKSRVWDEQIIALTAHTSTLQLWIEDTIFFLTLQVRTKPESMALGRAHQPWNALLRESSPWCTSPSLWWEH